VKTLRLTLGTLAALLVLLWRRTCSYEVINDPRPALRQAKRPYLYALLHAHQIAALFVNDEARLAAMVSRSADGDFLVPTLHLRGVMSVRGSTRKGDRDKGGRQALADLGELLQSGVPGLLAVDGPRGPRGHIHQGVADLAIERSAVILPTVVVCSRRWVLKKSWDRFQIPKPFARIRLCFSGTLAPRDYAGADEIRAAIARAIGSLERQYDPLEAQIAQGFSNSDGKAQADRFLG
jgi:lysophospholipid acyltransferase (LPLAT)-like uncharacterized protein